MLRGGSAVSVYPEEGAPQASGPAAEPQFNLPCPPRCSRQPLLPSVLASGMAQSAAGLKQRNSPFTVLEGESLVLCPGSEVTLSSDPFVSLDGHLPVPFTLSFLIYVSMSKFLLQKNTSYAEEYCLTLV